MKYRWNPDGMDQFVALPATVCERYLKLASEAAMKTLLWIVYFGHGDFNAAACAAATGFEPGDCEDAFAYWVQEGILLAAPSAAVAPMPVAQPPVACAQPAAPTRSAAVQKAKPPVPAARPKAVKPRLDEVMAIKESSEEFAYLLDTASARLGRPITSGDMETLCYLYETAGLPAEVILMVIVYAVSNEKPNMRYIEKVALNWADEGINTINAAEEYLCKLDRRTKAFEKVRDMLSLKQNPSAASCEMCERWIDEWHLPLPVIQLAGEYCEKQIGKFNFNYTNKVLERWNHEGIRTMEAAQNDLGKAGKGVSPSGESSLDLDEYEKWAQNYVPVYKKE